MIQEETNAEFRRNRIDDAYQKARVGEEQKMQRIEKERLMQAKIRESDNRKKQAQQRLATTLQRVFRGHLGRKIANKRALEQERAEMLLHSPLTPQPTLLECGGATAAEWTRVIYVPRWHSFCLPFDKRRQLVAEVENRLNLSLFLNPYSPQMKGPRPQSIESAACPFWPIHSTLAET